MWSVELQWNPLTPIPDFKVEFPALSLGCKPGQAPRSVPMVDRTGQFTILSYVLEG